MKRVLLPLSWLYSAIISIRNLFYEHHWFTIESVPVTVISVGNISVGGTGKTPLVKYIAGHMIASGKKTAVISRGYKRQSRGQVVVSDGNGPLVPVEMAGDEPYMLSYLLPECIVIVDVDRAAAAQAAIERYQADCIIMDDGFQHRRLARDYDIVVVPAADIVNRESVLPAGRLREQWSGLKRASHIILTGVDKQNEQPVKDFVVRRTDAKILVADKRTKPELLNPLTGDHIELVSGDTIPQVFAVAGIGTPEQFREALEKMPLQMVRFKTYPDHHFYTMSDQKELLAEFSESDAEYMVMTAKDFVKWDADLLRNHPIYYLPLQFEFSHDILAELNNI